ncbi:unnamed protein product [Adineta steineri]|uniref:G-protein coupled receptors family 1 profile domain-containing protein n=1 Tax=Adineta steineri TaxID=433720 RepID=A0A813P1B5_9BILA|nr:unnamed protein product [Adineta steineri]CAF3680173.1 unnamed protein product [Adineta steineri]
MKDYISNETWDIDSPEFSLPISISFWLLIIFNVPSLICSLKLLYHLINDNSLRKSLNNHVIIALLIIGLFSQLIDIPFYLNFLRIGYVWPKISLSCLLWWFSATGISNITNLLMAWASIERHILVFHGRWLRTKNRRYFIHYIPLLTIILYGFIYYFIILYMFSCENMYAYTEDWCLHPCYYNNNNLALYDTIVNSIIPTPIISFFSITLIIRIIKQKQTLHRQVQWRKYRRMIVQLLSISALFLFFNFPMTCIVLAQVCGLPDDSLGQLPFYTYYLYHFVSLLMPFVCLTSFPEIQKKIKQMIKFKKPINIIRPERNIIH